MGKKKNNSLGRSLIKDRFGNKQKRNNDSFLHTSELKDGYDLNKFNSPSVTEQDSLNEFLSTAQLAGTEFAAEKLNITFVDYRSGISLLTTEEVKEVRKSQDKYKDILKIPRRPKWDSNTTAEELQRKERESFLTWRKNLALFQEETNMILTPYEKNLDFWRQLWRVVERSDVLVQIVDARNPLMFRCEDLERYVLEVDDSKLNLILCNKADFLTPRQRLKWARYFDSIGVPVVFFSALISGNDENEIVDNENYEIGSDEEKIIEDYSESNSDFETDEEEETVGVELEDEVSYHHQTNSPKLLTRNELIEFFRNFPRKHKQIANNTLVTIGLVGYPNVGKSSTINALLTEKKVSVSATPGKTKHFQTLYLENDILLCDCPGLVMPSFALTKADMIINGVLPIDKMKDHVPSINFICTLIPRSVLENKYGIMIPKPEEGEDPNRPPFSEELLNAYAYSRGFMTSNGEPDNSRAARLVLKDFVNGKLLFCYAPPSVQQEEFHKFEKLPETDESSIPVRVLKQIKPFKVATRDLEYSLFQEQSSSNVHIRGIPKIDPNSMLRIQMNQEKFRNEPKPWKNHKEKRNKHVKSRVKYKCLDE